MRLHSTRGLNDSSAAWYSSQRRLLPEARAKRPAAPRLIESMRSCPSSCTLECPLIVIALTDLSPSQPTTVSE